MVGTFPNHTRTRVVHITKIRIECKFSAIQHTRPSPKCETLILCGGILHDFQKFSRQVPTLVGIGHHFQKRSEQTFILAIHLLYKSLFRSHRKVQVPSFLSHFLHPAQDVCYSSNYHLLLISTELSIYIDSVKSRQIIPALVFLLFYLPPTLYILFIKGTKYQQQTAKHFSIYSQRKEKLRTEVKKNFRTVPRLFQLFLIRTLCQRTNIKTNRKKKIICNFNSILALRPNGNLASNEGGKKIEARLKLVLRKIPIACVPPPPSFFLFSSRIF